MTLTFGSLFAGIGGFDLGFERAGMACCWQVEINGIATKTLEKHWPQVRRWKDIRDFPPQSAEEWRVDVICGGDPCPKHGNARRGQSSAHPDLSGYFLAVVGRLRPRWVVRENVPSPTVKHFATALEYLGYGTIIVRIDAHNFVPQARKRDFVVGMFGSRWHETARYFPKLSNDAGPSQTRLALEPICATLTTLRQRHNTDENYVFESGRVRLLDDQERARVTGFPDGWLAGLSPSACARGFGNAVVPQVAEWIGRRIVEADREMDRG